MTDTDKSIDDWVETLAGRRALVEGDEASAEAIALRQAMKENIGHVTARVADFESVSEDHGWQQLSFRLKKEGLLQRSGIRARTWIPLSAAAALALGVSVSVYFGSTSDDGVSFAVQQTEAPIYRAGDVATIAAAGPKPLVRAKKLALALQALNASPVVYSQAQPQVVTLDMEVPADKVDAVRQALARNGVDSTKVAAGLVRIVFRE